MRISEIFYSVQGEGPNLGTPNIFVRLSGCNLRCIFCDTPYALEGGWVCTIAHLVAEIRKFPSLNVVFTGGEPMLQQNELVTLMNVLVDVSMLYHFEIETNGSIIPKKAMKEIVDCWIVSPKMSNAGIKPYNLSRSFLLGTLNNVYFKFVVVKPSDLEEILEYLKHNPIGPEHVFLMPEATTVEGHNRKLPWIIEFAKQHGFRVTPRLHILAYGNVRGV